MNAALHGMVIICRDMVAMVYLKLAKKASRPLLSAAVRITTGRPLVLRFATSLLAVAMTVSLALLLSLSLNLSSNKAAVIKSCRLLDI